MRTHLDLFSGIGGFSLAAHWAGFRTVAFSEVCPDASRVLAHHWPRVPNLGSVSKLCRRAYDCEQRDDDVVWCLRCDANFGDCECVETDEFTERFGEIDLLTGGVPCQPASLLGARRGTADARWLWTDTLRIVGELRPCYCVFENPPALLTLENGRAFNGIISGLAALGYVGWYDVLPAAAIGAGHRRERVIIIAADAARWKSDDGGRGVLGQAERGREGFNSTAGACGEAAIITDAARVSFGNQIDQTDPFP
ncbi:MAG: hypothetical protein EB082_18350, partial [Verrucomicrobia bacterium]|nr:hypothetical protein [Verrucomicrobiota bacterium]